MGKSEEVRMTLRLPVELHDALVTEAENQSRSLNNLIAVVLKNFINSAKEEEQ